MLLHTHTHTRWTALCPGLPRWAGTRKVKPIWILLKQETVSGSGIHWAICKSAYRARQITMPTPHRSVFYRPHAVPVAQPTASKHYAASVTGKNRLWYLLTLAPGYGATEFTAHNWKARSSYSCIWVSLLLGRIAYIECKDVAHCYRYSMVFLYVCLQCFDAVGWAAGRASGL